MSRKGVEWIFQTSGIPVVTELKDEPNRDFLKEIPELLQKQQESFPTDFLHLRLMYTYWNPTSVKHIQLKKALKAVFALPAKL